MFPENQGDQAVLGKKSVLLIALAQGGEKGVLVTRTWKEELGLIPLSSRPLQFDVAGQIRDRRCGIFDHGGSKRSRTQ